MTSKNITILGAGITGLWQALTLARAGHHVSLVEKSAEPFDEASSWFAGAMLAPFCESESAEPIVGKLGLEAIPIWKKSFPGLKINGTLVLAPARDLSELKHFAKRTDGHRWLEAGEIENLEPDLANRFQSALFYESEAHLPPRKTMQDLLRMAEQAGVRMRFGVDDPSTQALSDDADDYLIDCTGMGAHEQLPELRGVRGEMAVIKSRDINLSRPVRLLHPRVPFYVVPWGGHTYMIGATVIESADPANVTLRSALDLLAMAYALHPGFGEAELCEFSTGIRPAFPDNIPKIVLHNQRHIYINGLFRHGFLLAPVLAELTRHYIETGRQTSELMIEN